MWYSKRMDLTVLLFHPVLNCERMNKKIALFMLCLERIELTSCIRQRDEQDHKRRKYRHITNRILHDYFLKTQTKEDEKHIYALTWDAPHELLYIKVSDF